MTEADYDDEYTEFVDEFLRAEENQGAFSIEINDINIWERIRTICFRRLLSESELGYKASTGASDDNINKYITGVAKWIKSLAVKNPFFMQDSEFLFIGTPRRKPREDGYMWDIYCDPILHSLNLDYVYTEPPYMFSHKKPAKTENIRYLDAITYTSVVQRKLGLAECKLSQSEINSLSQLEDALYSVFDVSVDIQDIASKKLSERKSRKWLYDYLLRKVDPKVAVTVAGAFKHTFIEVCKENGIPVVELQHGGGHHNHPSYSYPDDVDLECFPDYLFVFGEFWKDTVDYPIPQEDIYPIGYPYLESEKGKYSDIKSRKRVIFSSQWTIGEELSRFAANLSKRDTDYDVVYKLHPKEYDGWEAKYPWLTDAPVEVVDDDSIPLYKLLSQSEAHVGVYSTVVYEGLVFGLDTYLLDAPGITRMKYLIESGAASKVSSVDELVDSLKSRNDNSGFDIRYFFEEDPIGKVSDAFDDVLEKEY
jgi:hypothetical protein